MRSNWLLICRKKKADTQSALQAPIKFCKDIEPLIDTFRTQFDKIWEASKYGTADAHEEAALAWEVSTSPYKYIKPYPNNYFNDSNISLQNFTNWAGRIVFKKNPYERPTSPKITYLFIVHLHPFDSGQKIKIKGNHIFQGNIITAPNDVNKPSNGDIETLKELKIKVGIIITKDRFNVYTKVGRRCSFKR